MDLTQDILESLAAWKPINNFGNDGYGLETNVFPIGTLLESNGRIGVRYVQPGRDCKYYAILVYDRFNIDMEDAPCIMVQLSSLAPIGVYGLSTATVCEGSVEWQTLSMSDVCDPRCPPNLLGQMVVETVRRASPYTLLGPHIVKTKLSHGTVVYGECLGCKPWNRVYHALFAHYADPSCCELEGHAVK